MLKTLDDEVDSYVRDVDADPLPFELLGRVDRRTASTKRIKNNGALSARRPDDPFQQGDRLLRWIPEAFGRARTKNLNLPNVRTWLTEFVQVGALTMGLLLIAAPLVINAVVLNEAFWSVWYSNRVTVEVVPWSLSIEEQRIVLSREPVS